MEIMAYQSPRTRIQVCLINSLIYNMKSLKILQSYELISALRSILLIHSNGFDIPCISDKITNAIKIHTFIRNCTTMEQLYKIWRLYPIVHDGNNIIEDCVTITDSYAKIVIEWSLRNHFIKLSRGDESNEELVINQWKNKFHPDLNKAHKFKEELSPREYASSINKYTKDYIYNMSRVDLNVPPRVILVDMKNILLDLKCTLSPRIHLSRQEILDINQNMKLYSIVKWMTDRIEFICKCNTFDDVVMYYRKIGAYSRSMLKLLYNKQDSIDKTIRRLFKALLLIIFLRLDELVLEDGC